MSADTREWAWQQALPSRDKFVLVCLASYANGGHEAWPKQSQIAADTGMSKRSVERAIIALRSAGLISTEPRYRDDRSRTSDHITLQCEAPTHSHHPPTQCQGATDTQSAGCRHSDEGPTDTVATQEPSRRIQPGNQPREEHKDSAESSRAEYPGWFEKFWAEAKEHYRRAGSNIGSKKPAFTQASKYRERIDEVLDSLRQHADRKIQIREQNGFSPHFKHLERFIKNGDFEQELEPLPEAPKPARDPELEAIFRRAL